MILNIRIRGVVMDESIIIAGDELENDAMLAGEVVSDQDNIELLVKEVEVLHQDLVMTNTLLAVFIGAFAVYCFFKFLFKG